MLYDDSPTRARNRMKIVKVAKELFIQHGIIGTTVKDIVKAGDLERKTFYNYFYDKEELCDYIFYHTMTMFYQDNFFKEDYKDLQNGFDKVEKYLYDFLNAYAENRDDMTFIVYYEPYFKPDLYEDVLDTLLDDPSNVTVCELVEEGLNDGSLAFSEQKEIMCEILQSTMMSVANHKLSRSLQAEDEDTDYSGLQSLLEITLDYIKAK